MNKIWLAIVVLSLLGCSADGISGDEIEDASAAMQITDSAAQSYVGRMLYECKDKGDKSACAAYRGLVSDLIVTRLLMEKIDDLQEKMQILATE